MDFLTKKLPDFHGTVYFYLYGARGRTRTGTVSLPVDFESTTSANSITPAKEHIKIIRYFTGKCKP